MNEKKYKIATCNSCDSTAGPSRIYGDDEPLCCGTCGVEWEGNYSMEEYTHDELFPIEDDVVCHGCYNYEYECSCDDDDSVILSDEEVDTIVAMHEEAATISFNEEEMASLTMYDIETPYHRTVRILEDIDAALDRGDKEAFMFLTSMLKR